MKTFTHSGSVSEPINNAALLRAAGEFFIHVYRCGFTFSRVLSSEQAQAEALFLIERRYQGTDADGFDGILRDMAQCGGTGWRALFLVLGEIIKDTQREQYVRWVLNMQINQLDWGTRRDLTALMVQRWGAFLKGSVFKRSVEQLVPACADLIRGYATSNEALRQEWRLRCQKSKPSGSA